MRKTRIMRVGCVSCVKFTVGGAGRVLHGGGKNKRTHILLLSVGGWVGCVHFAYETVLCGRVHHIE